MSPSPTLAAAAATLLIAAPFTPSAHGADDARIEELERKQQILTDEIRRLRDDLVVPETQERIAAHGHGPAASKVYQNRGLSIGGYGEFNLKVADDGADDVFDFLRLVLYVGYKYNDWIVFNSELEFEHASSSSTVSSGSGSVSVEFAQLDFLLHPMANARVGMVLVPVGFANELHEPPFFHGNIRPPVEQQIIPSTWRANGAGFFGELAPGLNYRTYAVTSLNAKGFSSSNLRGGRQKGNRERANDFSWVGRVDYDGFEGFSVGGSAYLGNQGQGESYGGTLLDDGSVSGGQEADVFLRMLEGHAQYKAHGLEVRGLVTHVDIGDADVLSADPDIDDVVAEQMLGWYVELAYDILPLFAPGTTHYLAPWVRYSSVDSQYEVPSGFSARESRDREFIEVGLSYKPHPDVVLKADYRNIDSAGGDLPDEFRFGGGFVF